MLDSYFKLGEHGTTVKREVLAGCTTFLTMAYITFINPAILSDAGMDFGAVFVATCVAAAFGTLVMGLYANYPIALAPGMGLNAFFTYGVDEHGEAACGDSRDPDRKLAESMRSPRSCPCREADSEGPTAPRLLVTPHGPALDKVRAVRLCDNCGCGL